MIKYQHEDGTVAPALIVAENDDDHTVNLRVFGRSADEGDTFVNHVKRSELKSWASTSTSSSSPASSSSSAPAKKAPAKRTSKPAAKKAAAAPAKSEASS